MGKLEKNYSFVLREITFKIVPDGTYKLYV